MKRLNPAARTLVLICGFLFAVNIFLGDVLIRDSRRAIREQIESRMLDVAKTAAAMLNGDELRVLKAEDMNTRAYRDALHILSRFEENIELAYIYCVRALPDGSFIFTIDPDPESPGAFGEHIQTTNALVGASLGIPSVDSEAYSDRWGSFYSAYAPVFDSLNRVTGIVAVDFTAAWFDTQISRQVKTTLTISIASLLIAGLIVFLIVTRYRERFNQLFREMNLVSGRIETLVREVSPGADTLDWRLPDFESGEADELEALGARIHDLQEKLSEQIALVRSQAYIDALTGLENRAAYEERVKTLDDQIHEGRAAFAIAIFDLNGLKSVNDLHGHEKGDEVIRTAAAALREVFRDGRQYRIGGDEFIVILEGGHADMMERLDRVHGDREGFSTSAGCAVYDADSDADFRMVFNRADAAMYNDKREYYLTHGDRRRR